MLNEIMVFIGCLLLIIGIFGLIKTQDEDKDLYNMGLEYFILTVVGFILIMYGVPKQDSRYCVLEEQDIFTPIENISVIKKK